MISFKPSIIFTLVCKLTGVFIGFLSVMHEKLQINFTCLIFWKSEHAKTLWWKIKIWISQRVNLQEYNCSGSIYSLCNWQKFFLFSRLAILSKLFLTLSIMTLHVYTKKIPKSIILLIFLTLSPTYLDDQGKF